MKELAFALILVLVVVSVYLIVLAGSRIRQALQNHGEYHLVETSKEEYVLVEAVRGEQRQLVASVPFNDPDFDSKLWEARADGREKVHVLNNG
jgi:hypothetical protein